MQVKNKNLWGVLAVSLFCLITVSLVVKYQNLLSVSNNNQVKSATAKYIILAANDLGMHCMQANYDRFMILPPGNNLKVQVFKKEGARAELITKGLLVEYQVLNNTTSADKIDFWQYAADYGYQVKPGQGITGNYLQGECRLAKDGRFYEATAIPLTPYLDGNKKRDPYQQAQIVVRERSTGKLLAKTLVVLPVSDELYCSNCHGKRDTDANILIAHDQNAKTSLYADLANGTRHACSECHPDNALAATGKPGILPLSQAIHGLHYNKMYMSKLKNPCYNCHPGLVTKCNRGVMFKQGITCWNSKCHGNMKQVAATQAAGRKAWLEEPDCRNCHGQTYSSNPQTLYRNSFLNNAPARDMNDKILCASCHNSPHAEWPSTLAVDNLIPQQVQGKGTYIYKCSACHQGKGRVHQKPKVKALPIGTRIEQ